jgi:hypothetical protein
LLSRSLSNWRHLARISQPFMARFRAACRIQASVGLRVIPATWWPGISYRRLGSWPPTALRGTHGEASRSTSGQ